MSGAVVSTQRMRPAGGASAPPGGTGEPEGPVRLEPLGVGAILDRALDVLVARFAPCVGFAALFLIPFHVASQLFTMDARVLWQFTYLIPELVTAAFVCGLVGGHYLGRRVSAGHAFAQGVLALPGVACIALLQVTTSVGLACLCIVPMVFGYWLFAVVPAVYVLERDELVRRADVPRGLRFVAGVYLSIARGMRLVLGLRSFARWLGWGSVALVAMVLPLSSFTTALEAPAVRQVVEESLALQGRLVELAIAVITAAFLGIGTAYMAILETVYYLDERVRKEGFDLELRLRELEERSAPSARQSP